jgi:hypothetical protein
MIGFPLIYLVFAWLIFDLHSKGVLSIVLSPLFYLSSLFWIFSGIGIQRLRKWSWYTFVIAQFFVTYLNALNLVLYSQSEYKTVAFVITLVIQAYIFFVVSQELRVPYLFPKIRWWESGIAGLPSISTAVIRGGTQSQERVGFILDLNSRGCFIKTHLDYDPFEKVMVKFEAFGQSVELVGEVIWNAKSTVTHPKGIGVKFRQMSRQNKRGLRLVAQKFLKQKDPGKHENKFSA